MHFPAYAQQHRVTKNSLLTNSESLAYEMGKTYQLAQNCGQDLSNIAAPRAATLFLNYFEEHEVKIVMKQYKYSVTQENGKSCNLENIEVQILMNKIGNYIRLATPFSRTKLNEK